MNGQPFSASSRGGRRGNSGASQTSRQALQQRGPTLLPERRKRPYLSTPITRSLFQNLSASQASASAPTRQENSNQSPGASHSPQTDSQVKTLVARDLWHEHVKLWYPKLHWQTYFLPCVYFNRVSYIPQIVCGQSVLMSQTAPDQPSQRQAPSINFRWHNLNSSQTVQPLSSQEWPETPVPACPLPNVLDSDVRDDDASRQVLHSLRELANTKKEVMFVLSQLQFRKYLDDITDVLNAAANLMLPRLSSMRTPREGEFDVLIIHREYGIIVAELKAVGDRSKVKNVDNAVSDRVRKAVQQVSKAQDVLRHLLSDLPPVRITGTLMLPNITRQQLERALTRSKRTDLSEALCDCLKTKTTVEAVRKCLCSDNRDDWWKTTVLDQGKDPAMTPELYEELVARFCGPATSVEVPTITTPRHTMKMRTESEAIAHTGLRMAILTLYPEQVSLLDDPELPRVYLRGPPGTGKTVVLTLKGIQWRNRRKNVHLMSSHKNSQAIIKLIKKQLMFSSSADTATGVYCHSFDFENNDEDVVKAVSTLVAAATDGELYLIVDEAHHTRSVMVSSERSGRFSQFCQQLHAQVRSLHLWAATVRCDTIVPSCMEERRLTTSLRCPPVVVDLVQQSSLIDDSHVPRYTSNGIPAPTDGPQVRVLHHRGEIGHTTPLPEDCELCAQGVADLIQELLKDQVADHDLQYRDIFVICQNADESIPVFTRLRRLQIPVQVVTANDNEAAIERVALATEDAVTVTDGWVVSGLERRIVIVLGLGSSAGYDGKLYAMSRSTSLLAYVD